MRDRMVWNHEYRKWFVPVFIMEKRDGSMVKVASSSLRESDVYRDGKGGVYYIGKKELCAALGRIDENGCYVE